MSTKLKAQTRERLERLRVKRERRTWQHPKKQSKQLDFDRLPSNLAQTLQRMIKPRDLQLLRLDELQFEAALHETVARLRSKKRSTVDQMVGTFLEVIGGDHPVVADVRYKLAEQNLIAALDAVVSGEQTFFAAGTAHLPDNAAPLETELALPWRQRKPVLSEITSGDREAQLGRLAGALDMQRVHYVRDLTIDGLAFCDRAVLLHLSDDRWLLLLSEEYKTPGSGGLNPQMAIRNNRLWNDKVSASSSFGFIDAAGAQRTITLDKLVVNAATSASDALGVKAASRDRFAQRLIKFTEGVIERKKAYGEVVVSDEVVRRKTFDGGRVPLGDADRAGAYFVIGLLYPSATIRSLFERVFRDLAP